jgi:hypothetical protein
MHPFLLQNFRPFIKHLRIQESTLHDFVIYSDSLSSLESYRTTLSNPTSIAKSNPRRNSQSGSRLGTMQDIVIFKAMRQADKAAKGANNLQMLSDLKMNTYDLKSKIKNQKRKHSNMAKLMGTYNPVIC